MLRPFVNEKKEIVMHGAEEERVTQKLQQKFKFQMNYSRVIPVQMKKHNVDGEIHVGYR